MIGYLIELNFITQLLLIYLVIINLIAFFYFGWDKLCSQMNKRRISEKTLWGLSLIGGSLGALVGMNFFRHKTKKLSFQAGMAIILVIQIFLITYLITDY